MPGGACLYVNRWHDQFLEHKFVLLVHFDWMQVSSCDGIAEPHGSNVCG
jgi:hypothetical protein